MLILRRKIRAARLSGCAHGATRERGFTYIVLLMLVAMMGIALVATEQVLSVAMKREREAELLFVGNQFRNAISLYYRNSQGRAMSYPTSLDDLLKDPRYPDTRRYLRKIYLDPISNSPEWGLVKSPDGEILGVHSLSTEEPLKQSNFRLVDQEFEGKKQYSDWTFMQATSGVPAANALVPGQAQQNPMQQNPMQQSPMQQNPMQQSPMQQNPMQQNPMQQNPMQQNPMQQSPMQQNPMQQNPMQQSPAQQSPAQQSPAQQSPAQQSPAQQNPPPLPPSRQAPAMLVRPFF